MYQIFIFIKKTLFLTYQLFTEKRSIILVHSMGKVGSTTIINSLESSLPNYLILQIHHLELRSILKAVSFHLKREKAIPHNLVIGLSTNIFLRLKRRELTIISLVREPISRAISNYFQLEDRFYMSKEETSYNFVVNNLMSDLEELASKDSYYNLWFDKNLNSIFKFDVFKYPYDKGKGIYFKNEKFTFAVLRMDDINDLWPQLFDRLFPGNHFAGLRDSNKSVNKPKHELYKRVKKHLVVEEQMKNKILKQKTVTHFYSPEELSDIHSKFQ